MIFCFAEDSPATIVGNIVKNQRLLERNLSNIRKQVESTTQIFSFVWRNVTESEVDRGYRPLKIYGASIVTNTVWIESTTVESDIVNTMLKVQAEMENERKR